MSFYKLSFFFFLALTISSSIFAEDSQTKIHPWNWDIDNYTTATYHTDYFHEDYRVRGLKAELYIYAPIKSISYNQQLYRFEFLSNTTKVEPFILEIPSINYLEWNIYQDYFKKVSEYSENFFYNLKCQDNINNPLKERKEKIKALEDKLAALELELQNLKKGNK